MKNNKKIILITSLFLSFNLQAQDIQSSHYTSGDEAYWNSSNAAPINLSKSQIMSSGLNDWSREDLDNARFEAIKVSASSLGAQAGQAARTKEIHNALLSRASQYDKSFNFSLLMLEPGFLPPVISEGRNAYNQPNSNEARAADRIFKIERPARIVPVAPSWRVYLLSDPVPAARPDTSLLPKTREEKAVWDEWANKGWEQGVKLADANFEENLARLKHDFEGMVRFKMLYEQGLVSKPILARSNLGVTGGGEEMAINDRIIHITAQSALDANTNNWSTNKPITSDTDK